MNQGLAVIFTTSDNWLAGAKRWIGRVFGAQYLIRQSQSVVAEQNQNNYE